MGDRSLNLIEVRAWCRALGVSFPEFVRELDELLMESEKTIESETPEP